MCLGLQMARKEMVCNLIKKKLKKSGQFYQVLSPMCFGEFAKTLNMVYFLF